jgi:hypothetical protein
MIDNALLAEMDGVDLPYGEPPRPPKVGDKVALRDQHGLPYFTGPFKIVAVEGKRIEIATPRGTVVLWEGYGLGSAQWVFAEKTTPWLPPIYVQLADVRHGMQEKHRTYLAERKSAQYRIPKCPDCGHWPCHGVLGCVDFWRLAKGGALWLNGRFETMEETVERYRIRGPRIPQHMEPKPIEKRKAA